MLLGGNGAEGGPKGGASWKKARSLAEERRGPG